MSGWKVHTPWKVPADGFPEVLLIMETSRKGDRLVVWHSGIRTCLDSLWIPYGSPVYYLGEERNEFVGKFIKKALAKVGVVKKGGRVRDPVFEKQCPAVFEFLTETEGEGGESRETATLNIFSQDGLWKCFLNDRESRQSLCVSADTFAGLLAALEGDLTSDGPNWRPLGGGVPKKGTKKG